jgi:hypothetical protein
MSAVLAFLSHDVPTLGPIGVGNATLGTVWQQVLAADAVRRGVWFHNPGTNILRVAPANLAAQNNAGALLIYPQTDQSIFATDPLMNVNCAWMAWVDVGSNQPISILNFTGANLSVPSPQPLAQLNVDVPITSPLTYGVALATTSISVIGANRVRRGIIFHNPGTVNLFVCPANLVAANGAGSFTLLPGQTRQFLASGGIRVNCGWNGIAASSSGNPLTVMEIL